MEKEPSQKQKKQKMKGVNPLRDTSRVVPFVVPDKQERMQALGTLAGQKWRIKKSLLAIYDQFQPIKAPKPGYNLFQNYQENQGFGLFASKRRNYIDIDKQTIYICPFHTTLSKDIVKRVKKNVKSFFFGAKVKLFDLPQPHLQLFEPLEGPEGAKYYNGVKINEYFAKQLPKNTYSIAIITNLLIYNGDNPKEQLDQRWVFGLGSVKHRTSVISFQQLLLKDFGGQRDENVEDEDEFNIEFLEKVVNHELCHTFGMRHCIYHQCLMNGSNSYEESISKQIHLCPICVRKLQLALGFDICQRYEALGDQKSCMLADKIKTALNIKIK